MKDRVKLLTHIYNDEAVDGWSFGAGLTTPTDGDAGWAPGAFFGNTSTGVTYRNNGTLTSCDFNELENSSIDGDAVGTTDTQALTNKTIDGDLNTLLDIGTTSLEAVTGSDTTVVTGTAGTDGNCGQWNADGDLVNGKPLPTGTIIGTSDTQTLTNKTLTSPKINEDVALTATATELNAKVAVTTAVHSLGTPVVADVDLVVTIANMKVGTYTVAASPDVPRNLTVTHATVGGVTDTLGTIDIVGTDYDDAALTETITPVADSAVAGTKAFKTVTSVTGVGWVINTTEDTITVGIGDEIGLPVSLASAASMIAAWADGSFVTVDGAVGDPATLAETTIDASAATYDGSKVIRVLVSS